MLLSFSCCFVHLHPHIPFSFFDINLCLRFGHCVGLAHSLKHNYNVGAGFMDALHGVIALLSEKKERASFFIGDKLECI